jgi:SPP1 family predicted phage head-tail adaptor
MKAGEMDQRVQLQSRTENNVSGALTPAYETFDTVWAKVIVFRNKADSNFQAAQIQTSQLLRMCIRFRTDVTTKTRLMWEGQNYNVLEADVTQRRKGELWLTAQLRGAE